MLNSVCIAMRHSRGGLGCVVDGLGFGSEVGGFSSIGLIYDLAIMMFASLCARSSQTITYTYRRADKFEDQDGFVKCIWSVYGKEWVSEETVLNHPGKFVCTV